MEKHDVKTQKVLEKLNNHTIVEVVSYTPQEGIQETINEVLQILSYLSGIVEMHHLEHKFLVQTLF